MCCHDNAATKLFSMHHGESVAETADRPSSSSSLSHRRSATFSGFDNFHRTSGNILQTWKDNFRPRCSSV